MTVDQIRNLQVTPVAGGAKLTWSVEPTSYLDGFSFIVKEQASGKVLVNERRMDASLRAATILGLPAVACTFNVAVEQRVGGQTAAQTPLPVAPPGPVQPPEIIAE